MVATSEVALFREANIAISELAKRDLNLLWATLDLGNPRASRDVLLELVPEITGIYGEQAALVAADWYDMLREESGIPGQYTAAMAATVPREFVEKRVRYGAGHLFTDTPDLMLPFLDTAISEYVLQPGRDTIQQSSMADPYATGWHRETRPSESYAKGCGFCNMLAGRGGVYKRSTARFAAHGNCQCVAVPSWDASAKEVHAAVYEASKKTTGMSEAQREAHNKRIRDYVEAHYPGM